MAIIKIKEKIDSQDLKTSYNFNAIKKDNTISYIKDNTKIKLVLFKDNIILKSENDDISYKLKFIMNKKTNSRYYLKKNNLYLNIIVITKDLCINEFDFNVFYEIYVENQLSQKVNLKLEWSYSDEHKK